MTSPRSYALISATIFLLAAFAHLTRLVDPWEIAIAGRTIPHWVSIPGLIVAGGLSGWGFLLASRTSARGTTT